MGRKSNAKQEKQRLRRDRPRLLAALTDQRSFLEVSARAFDNGEEAEALRLAVAIRVLVHDTGSSTSLLGQLGVKDSIGYVDTAAPVQEGNLLPTTGLVMHRFEGPDSRHVPVLDDGPPLHYVNPPLPFRDWWSAGSVIVLPDQDGRWSRENLVLALAHKEGGAHVDPHLYEPYEELVTRNAVGWRLGLSETEEVPFPGNLVAVSVRQVAHELLQTLEASAELISGGED